MIYLYKTLLIVLAMSLWQCSDSTKNQKTTSPRKEVFSKITSPKNNHRATVGDSIKFEVKSKSASISIDSVVLIYNGTPLLSSKNPSFKWSSKDQKVGLNTFVLSTFLTNGTVEKKIVNTIFLSDIVPEIVDYEIIETYPHDITSYTQGLLIDDDIMYESTGLRDKSFIKKIDIKKGISTAESKLDPQFFGEGISIIGDRIYMLTYTSHTGFVYDKNTLEPISKFGYQTEGWGLTNLDENTLIMSDGSHKLYLKDPNDFSTLNTIEVYDNNELIDSLNELEYIDGKLFANRYTTNLIYIIDLKTGKVEKIIDLSEIYDWKQYDGKIDYLNGIAYNPNTNDIYVTGKLWPVLFKIKLK